jgi:hypothetical protein
MLRPLVSRPLSPRELEQRQSKRELQQPKSKLVLVMVMVMVLEERQRQLKPEQVQEQSARSEQAALHGHRNYERPAETAPDLDTRPGLGRQGIDTTPRTALEHGQPRIASRKCACGTPSLD